MMGLALVGVFGTLLSCMTLGGLLNLIKHDTRTKLPCWVWYRRDMKPFDDDDPKSPRGYWLITWDVDNQIAFADQIPQPATVPAIAPAV